MQYLICLDIYLMGDDYMYGTYAHQGVFPSVFSYYFTGNGRWLVNILDCLCLYFDRILYVIFNPWLLLLLGFMLYRLISLLSGEKSPVVMAACLCSGLYRLLPDRGAVRFDDHRLDAPDLGLGSD